MFTDFQIHGSEMRRDLTQMMRTRGLRCCGKLQKFGEAVFDIVRATRSSEQVQYDEHSLRPSSQLTDFVCPLLWSQRRPTLSDI